MAKITTMTVTGKIYVLTATVAGAAALFANIPQASASTMTSASSVSWSSQSVGSMLSWTTFSSNNDGLGDYAVRLTGPLTVDRPIVSNSSSVASPQVSMSMPQGGQLPDQPLTQSDNSAAASASTIISAQVFNPTDQTTPQQTISDYTNGIIQNTWRQVNNNLNGAGAWTYDNTTGNWNFSSGTGTSAGTNDSANVSSIYNNISINGQ